MSTDFPSKVSKMKDMKIISVTTTSDAINFMDALALLFIGLHLTGHLENWTWVEILSPLWGPFMVKWLISLITATFFDDVDEEEH